MGLLSELKDRQASAGQTPSLDELPKGDYLVDSVKFRHYKTKFGGNMFFVNMKINDKEYSTSTLFSGYSKNTDEDGNQKYTAPKTAVERLVDYNLTKESKFVDLFINELEYLIQENGSEDSYKALEQTLNDNIGSLPAMVSVTESGKNKFVRLGFCVDRDVLEKYKLVGEQSIASEVAAEPVKSTDEDVTNNTMDAVSDETASFAEKLENDTISFL